MNDVRHYDVVKLICVLCFTKST